MKRQVSPWLILVGLAIVWKLIYAYWTPIYGHYLVPPGDDPVVHLTQITRLMAGHWALFGGTYPLGFHIMVAILAIIFHMSALHAVIWFTPLLLVIPIISIYYTGSRWFDSPLAGAVAAAAWGFLALAPIRAYGDGNYPDLLAASTVLPLCLLALKEAVTKPRPRSIMIALLLIILIAFIHHLTLLYMIVISIPWLIYYAFTKAWHLRRQRGLIYLMTALLCGIFLIAVFYFLYNPLLTPYLNALHAGRLDAFVGATNQPISWLELLEIHNTSLVVLGLVGMLAVVISNVERSSKLLLASWILVLLFLSTTSFFGLQGRFVRELAVPFALAIGYLAQFLYEHTLERWRNLLIPSAVAIVLFTGWIQSFSQPFSLPDPYQPLIRVQHDEEAAFPVLEKVTPPNQPIITINNSPYLPFLVNRTVIVLAAPDDAPLLIAHYSEATIYVAIPPPLTYGLPLYQGNAELAEALFALPNLHLVDALPNGSKIYRYIKP